MRGYVQALAAAAIWGTAGILVRAAATSPFVVTGLAAAFGTCLLAVASWRSGSLVGLQRAAVRWRLLAAGVFGLGTNLAFYASFQYTSIAVATFLHYLAPIFVAAAASIVLGQRTDGRGWLAVVIGLAGVLLIFDPTTSHGSLLGPALAVLSAVFYAAGVLLAARIGAAVGSDLVVLGNVGISAAILAPATALALPTLDARAVLPLAILGFMHLGVAMLLFYDATTRIPASHAAVLAYGEPAVALVVSTIALHEPLTANLLAGCAAITLAGALVITRPAAVRRSQRLSRA